eukprot:7639034-Lingulodinium_polyedra.AAC.1
MLKLMHFPACVLLTLSLSLPPLPLFLARRRLGAASLSGGPSPHSVCRHACARAFHAIRLRPGRLGGLLRV